MADGGRSYIDHDDRFGGGHFMKKRKGRGPFRAKMYSEGPPKYQNRGSYAPNPRSRLDDDDDGDIAMSDAHDPVRSRFNPYSRGGRKRDDRQARDTVNFHGNTSRNPAHHTRTRNEPREDKSWFRVTVLHGNKYDKSWLIGLLQSSCMLPFTPIAYHCDQSRAHFFVEDSAVAKALKKVSRTFTDRENFKVTILTRPCAPPSIKDMPEEEIVHLKNSMQKRYDGAQQALNMKSLRTDPDLIENKVDAILSRKSYMNALLQIIEENVPELLSLDLSNNKLYSLEHLSEIHLKAPNLKILNLSDNMLKSEKEMTKIKGLKLEMLWLSGNPFCRFYKDQSAYISAMRERFPKLLQLDGFDLPPPITFDVETPTTLPLCKGSYLATDDIKALVLRFLQQYYVCYDSEDRQGLLNVYHDEACCSLSVPGQPGQNPTRSSLGEYFSGSRNIKRLRDPALRFKLLKHKRLNVVSFLNGLPRTQHDLNSFVVDITAQSNMLLCFVVNGVFKVEGQSSDPVRAFTRAFIAVPGTDGGLLLLVNDEQFIRNATTDEIRKAFATPAPTPSSSPVPVLAPVPQDIVQAFSLFSGMNAEWSQKCLQDNGWEFEQAAQIFMKLKAEGKIPEVAFIK